MKLTLHVILGGAALLALVITLAFGRQSPAPVAPPLVAQDEPLKKQDRISPPRVIAIEALKTAMNNEKLVPTETIRPPEPPTIIPPIVQVQEDEPAPKRRRVKTASVKRSADVCQRHGLRKVQYGKRWRCRR
jgi:hypothetical protein